MMIIDIIVVIIIIVLIIIIDVIIIIVVIIMNLWYWSNAMWGNIWCWKLNFMRMALMDRCPQNNDDVMLLEMQRMKLLI